MMANLVAESGGNKGKLSNLVEALCRDFDLLYFTKINLDEEAQWASIAFSKRLCSGASKAENKNSCAGFALLGFDCRIVPLSLC